MTDTQPETDIAELFQRDPTKLSERDITAIITKFRGSRKQFMLGNTNAGSTKPKTEKQKTAIALANDLSLNVKDLL